MFELFAARTGERTSAGSFLESGGHEVRSQAAAGERNTTSCSSTLWLESEEVWAPFCDFGSEATLAAG